MSRQESTAPNRVQMIKRRMLEMWRLIPLLVVLGTIYYVSSQPGDPFGISRFQGLDKGVHGLAYGALALSALIAVQPLKRRVPRLLLGLGVIVFCVLAGIGDEIHQSRVPTRVVDGWDVLADTTGAATAVGLWLLKLIRL